MQAWARTRRMAEVDAEYKCPSCVYTCGTRQQLATHAFTVHGVCRKMRAFTDTDHCPVCMQWFGTRTRVIVHWEEKSPRCRRVVLERFRQLPEDTVAVLDERGAEEARTLGRIGRRRYHADTRATRLAGPLMKEAFEAGLDHKSLLSTRLPEISASG